MSYIPIVRIDIVPSHFPVGGPMAPGMMQMRPMMAAPGGPMMGPQAMSVRPMMGAPVMMMGPARGVQMVRMQQPE